LAPGQWLNDTMIEFHMEFLERTFVPKDANYLFLRPGIVHLITFAEGKYFYLHIPKNKATNYCK
jgi:sentrin-specific protease 8